MQSSEIRKRNPEFTPTVLAGVNALRAGQRGEARQRFAQAVRKNPENATAWFWLSRALDDEFQRQECLDRVRRLDVAARRTLPARHGHPRRWALAVAVLLAIAACVAAPLLSRSRAQARTPDQAALDRPLEASGLIYAEEILLSSEYGGRIQALAVQEGDIVRAGQVVVRLDVALLDAQIEAAQAAVDLAEAGLALARAGARPGQHAIAEAQLAQATAARVAAARAVSDTMMLLDHPQDIQLQISVLRAEIEAATHKLSKALALKDAAEIGKDGFYEAQRAIHEAGGPGEKRIRAKVAEGSWDDIVSRLPPEVRDALPSPPADGVYTLGSFEVEIHGTTYIVYRWVVVHLDLPFEAHLAPNVWWQAWVGVNAAAAQKEGAEASLELLYDRRARPLELQAQVDQALAALLQAEAQVAMAQAQVDGLRAGATAEQLGILEAQVAQAQAALEALLIQREQMQVLAPIDGVVVALTAHEGEVAARGAALVTLARLSAVRLDIYLPEPQIGKVSLGERVEVRVDSFPERVFVGTIGHIADSAEFTPRNIATQEERVNLVFAVQVDLDNADGALKPGMPADATFGRR